MAIVQIAEDTLGAVAHWLAGADPDHSEGEERWLTFGISRHGNFLVVSHTDQEETIKLISARAGTKLDRKLYEEG